MKMHLSARGVFWLLYLGAVLLFVVSIVVLVQQ